MEVNDVVGAYGNDPVSNARYQDVEQQTQTEEAVAVEQTQQNTEYQEANKGQNVDYSA